MLDSAAVLLAILDDQVILTKRAARLRSFTGHVCLPGGKSDPDDEGVVATAIREFHEEVYFEGQVEPKICMLPELSVVTQQVVFPVVAVLKGTLSGFNPDEVAKLLLLPLDKLAPEVFEVNPIYPRIRHNQQFNYSEEVVWGLTAHILYKFSENYLAYFKAV